MPADATAEPAAPGLVPASPAPVPPGRTHVSVFEPQWPGPGRIAPRRAVVGAAVAAVVAAATLTWDRPGLG